MGRYSTGAITTGEVKRIELSYLLRQGYIQKGCEIQGTISWTDDSNISFESKLTGDEAYLRLIYTNTNSYTGEKTNHDYKVYLTTIPSNLGKGEILYFVCPVTGKRCRILYKCYGSFIWKSRTAYRHRIYYASQQCSKYYYHNTRYWAIDKELEKCYKRSRRSHYKGKPTRLIKRVEQLEERKQYHDMMRYIIVPQAIKKMVNEMGLYSAKNLF